MSQYTGLIGLPKIGQSPIDLNDSVVRLKRFPPLILNGHWLNDGEAILLNDGTSAEVHLSGDRIPSTVCGGPLLNDEYEFYTVHFHWGEENCRGAEHTINGTWFSMESHVVHWNRKYLSFEESLKHKDGLCILSYLFLVQPGLCEWSNTHLQKITENLKYVREPGTEVKIPANSLCWMRRATSCSNYYTYKGSCSGENFPECVTWIIFPLMLPIQPCQIGEFRKLKNLNGERIKSNWRKTQVWRGRRIFRAIP